MSDCIGYPALCPVHRVIHTPTEEEAVGRLAEIDDCVHVDPALARRIRLALDHACRDAAGSPESYQRLATELVESDGYPIDDEPWS